MTGTCFLDDPKLKPVSNDPILKNEVLIYGHNKIEKQFIEEYKDAVDEAEELLRISEIKSIEFITDFKNELEKRKNFTYNLGSIAEKNKAETSLKRAKNFVRIIERMIK